MELVASLGAKMEQLAREFGPGTIELARSAALVEAWDQLYVSLAWGLIWAAGAAVSYKLIRFGQADLKVHKVHRADRSGESPKPVIMDDDGTWFLIICGLVAAIVFGLLAAIMIFEALSPWSIAQIVNPDLVIARKILDF